MNLKEYYTIVLGEDFSTKMYVRSFMCDRIDISQVVAFRRRYIDDGRTLSDVVDVSFKIPYNGFKTITIFECLDSCPNEEVVEMVNKLNDNIKTMQLLMI